jgi:hypothetical protein
MRKEEGALTRRLPTRTEDLQQNLAESPVVPGQGFEPSISRIQIAHEVPKTDVNVSTEHGTSMFRVEFGTYAANYTASHHRTPQTIIDVVH